MNLSYRKMKVDDMSSVFSVRLATKENSITMEELEEEYGITPESLAEAMKKDVEGWLCEDSGTVVGFSMGNASNGEIIVLAVLPEYEGNGIGKTMLIKVQDWLFSKGHRELFLLTPPYPKTKAQGFYQNLGWQPTGKMVDEDETYILQSEPPPKNCNRS